MEKITEMYVTLLPVILAGIMNMVWCKVNICGFLKKPVDFGKNFFDGRRIFGDNKTFKGFMGMILFGAVFSVLWGIISLNSDSLTAYNYFYRNYDNSFLYNILIGTLMGFAYALFELPNSFLKRRLDITPGKNDISGIKKVFFIFLDQADSIFGCVLVVCIFYPLPIWYYFIYVLLGAATHIILNMLLYFCHLRKNMF
ncbi:MAG: CDP-archaeol synthase [Lachnospiraceae bacterium]|nr:CDP-archaeol synthase [Lachnospiraceae bacterium]